MLIMGRTLLRPEVGLAAALLMLAGPHASAQVGVGALGRWRSSWSQPRTAMRWPAERGQISGVRLPASGSAPPRRW